MKNLIVAGFMLSNFIAPAQNKAGKVIYTETAKLDFAVDSLDSQMAAIAAMMPKEINVQTVLYFNSAASFYQMDKSARKDEGVELSAEGNMVKMMVDQQDEKMFCDFKNQKRIEQKDFMTRKFLIESEIGKQEWKLTGKQKMILNYPCQEAIMQVKESKVTAWFTPAISSSAGPRGYGGLPGLILSIEMSQEQQNMIITAKKVDLTEPDKALLKIPKEGKKVTEQEFEAIVLEKTKEIQQQYGGNGNVIIEMKTK